MSGRRDARGRRGGGRSAGRSSTGRSDDDDEGGRGRGGQGRSSYRYYEARGRGGRQQQARGGGSQRVAPAGGRRGEGRGRGGPPPPPSQGVRSVLTNMITAKVGENFSFYQYSVECTDGNGKAIDGRGLRYTLFKAGFDQLLAKQNLTDKQKKDRLRTLFFIGSGFYAARAVPEIPADALPFELFKSNANEAMAVVQVSHYSAPTEITSSQQQQQQEQDASQLHSTSAPPAAAVGPGEVVADSFRCRDCSKSFGSDTALLQHCRDTGHSPVYYSASSSDAETALDAAPAPPHVFLAYANVALAGAMGERMARWGREFVDQKSETPAKDRNGNDLGVNVYQAYACTFGLNKLPGERSAQLTLTCDLRAKIIRTKSLLHAMYGDNPSSGGRNLGPQDKKQFQRDWVGEVVIYKNEKKCEFSGSNRFCSLGG